MTLFDDKRCAFAASIVRAVSRAGFGIAIARLGGVEAYPTFVLLIAVEVVALALVQSAWLAPLTTLVPACPDASARRRLLHRAAAPLRLPARASWIVALAFGVAGEPLVAAFTLALAANARLALARAWWSATFRSQRTLVAELLSAALPTLALTATALYDGPIVPAFFASWALGAFVTTLGLRVGALHDDGETERAALARLGRPMLIGTIANSLCARLQPFVLGLLGGAATVASYGASLTLIGPVRLLATSLSSVLRPRLALHAVERPAHFRRLVRLSAALLGGGAVALTCLFALAGTEIGEALFGSDFGDLRPTLVAGAIYAGLEGIGAILVVAIQASRHDGAAVATRYRVRTLGLALIAMLIGSWGAGSAGAFAAAALVEAIFASALWRASAPREAAAHNFEQLLPASGDLR